MRPVQVAYKGGAKGGGGALRGRGFDREATDLRASGSAALGLD